MDYFTRERMKSAEEVVAFLPDTMYSAATFQGILTKQQIKEVRLSISKLRVDKTKKPHMAFKKFMRLGMNTLRKALDHVREQGLPVCEGAVGCNACCRRLTIITSNLEVTAITHWLRTASSSVVTALRESLNRTEFVKKSVLLAMGVVGEDIPDIVLHTIGSTFPECGGQCPALGATGECLIYPVRPWSCRTYRALSHECAPMARVNLARFPDIDIFMLDMLEKHAGTTKTTLFPVIRRALGPLRHPLSLVRSSSG